MEHQVASESLLNNPETWVAAAFVIFVALMLRYLAPKIGKSLDNRGEKIREQLEQASRLRAEAEALLTSYQKEQQDLLKQAEGIITTAKKDAALLRETAAEELKAALERRSAQAQEKIARAEGDAIAKIRARIVHAATDKARDMLAEKADSSSDEAAVSSAIRMIEQQVH